MFDHAALSSPNSVSQPALPLPVDLCPNVCRQVQGDHMVARNWEGQVRQAIQEPVTSHKRRS